MTIATTSTSLTQARREGMYEFACHKFHASAWLTTNAYGEWVWECEIMYRSEDGSESLGPFNRFWDIDALDEWVASIWLAD